CASRIGYSFDYW
nr:immunoglobulin heavy chain junction region [Macaca mulatta]